MFFGIFVIQYLYIITINKLSATFFNYKNMQYNESNSKKSEESVTIHYNETK